MKTILCVFVLVLLQVTIGQTDCPEWSYSGSNGPDNWGNLCPAYATCSTGRVQSPIDISTSSAIDEDFIGVEIVSHTELNLNFFNNGHTIEVEFEEEHLKENYMLLDNSDRFNLLQFHLHTPSENSYNGKHYDMEIHFVHGKGEPVELAVLGVFVDAPDNDNPCQFLAALHSAIPEEDGEENNLNFGKLSNYISLDDDTEYFRFMGSLTTPPCTEGVNWIVRKEPIRCAKSQVEEIFEVLNVSNRPVQPKNGRNVFIGSNDENSSTSFSSSSRSTDSSDSSVSSKLVFSFASLFALVLLF